LYCLAFEIKFQEI